MHSEYMSVLKQYLQTGTKIILEKWTCLFITTHGLLRLLEESCIWLCNTNFAFNKL